MEQKLFSLLVETDEISWKSIIYDLVQQEGMDPWNIDVSKLANLYIERVHSMQVDLKVSGKVVLAAAILLRIKSKRLVGADLNEFDRLLASDANEVYDELEQQLVAGEERAIAENIELLPRTPQPRARKVSVHDLVRALEKALEVKKRRMLHMVQTEPPTVPTRTFDLAKETEALLARIVEHYAGTNSHLTFSSVLPQTQTKNDKVFTFIPLLHLSHQQKIELLQEQHFGEILIALAEGTHVNAG